MHALGDAEQVLDVMPDLVRDNVSLREVAGRAEAILQVAVEREVDVELLVGGAVERPDRGLGITARRLYLAGEKHQRGLAIGPAGPSEDFGPNLLGRTEHGGDEIGHLVFAGWGFCLDRLRRSRRYARGHATALQDDPRIDAKEHRDQRDHDDADAATGDAAPDRHAAAVFDVGAALLVIDTHGDLLLRGAVGV